MGGGDRFFFLRDLTSFSVAEAVNPAVRITTFELKGSGFDTRVEQQNFPQSEALA